MAQPDMADEAEKLFEQALESLDAEDTITALGLLERALKLRDTVGWRSWLGFCIARERGQHRRGQELCQESLAAEPDQPAHYLNLGRVHLIAGDKAAALRVMREGMTKGEYPQLARMLERLGSRRRPVFPSLSRTNPINKYLGVLLSRLGVR
jgi:predicted Zn-dependent protease